MDSSVALEQFLQRRPPAQTQPVPPERIAAYQGILPDELLDLWRTSGWGKYGGGLIELIDPDAYQDLLNGWLGDPPPGSRIPIMLSAFGVLYYWRRLGQILPDGRAEAYDVAYLNPHNSDTDVLAWDAASFLGEHLGTHDLPHDLDPFGVWPSLEERAATELEAGVIYGFVPALRLGGDLQSAAPQRAPEHLALLLMLAEQSEAPDLEDELTTPEQCEAREAELRARLEELSDPVERAAIHAELAHLLLHAPWHDLPGDSSARIQAAGRQAVQEYLTAYTLDPRPEWLFEQADAVLNYLPFEQADQAARLYAHLLSLGSDPARARRGLIRRAWLHDDYAVIEEHARALLDEFPNDPDLLLDLARAHKGQARYAEALPLLERAAEQMEPYGLAAVLGEQAECLIALDRRPGAEALFEAALARETNPILRHELFNGAVTAFRAGQRPAAALDFLTRLIDETDRKSEYSLYPHHLYTAAELRSELGQHDAALQTVEELLTLPQGQRGYHQRLKGEVLTQAGRTREAVSAYREALRIDPHTPGVQDALDRLRSPRRGLLARLLGQ